MSIQSRVPREDYDQIVATNISRLKEIGRSPQHYQYRLTHPRISDALTLGTATHTATLEPERFAKDFAIWDRRTDSGKMAPRNGKWWDAFQAANKGLIMLTEDEAADALHIALAVRANPLAMKYLEAGDPEVTMEWILAKRQCKGRVDWITRDDKGKPVLVGLKTARDCRYFAFGSQAAKLGYHQQWAWYHDGFEAITGQQPQMVEIVVETEAPHAVTVYIIPNDVLDQGREEYSRYLDTLASCEASGEWPGPSTHEEFLTLPTWAYTQDGDDITDLGLEAAA